MNINTRFAVAIHILTLIELNNLRGIPNSSENLALSVKTNPVVIRRIMAMLKKAGLVEVKAGIGAAFLGRKPEDITWLEVFHAVNGDEDFVLFRKHENPNSSCYVGAYILDVLDGPFAMVQKAMEDKLASFTLMDAIYPIAQKNNINL